MTTEQVKQTFDRFLAENNNKFIERVDSNALNQCFDLAIYWCEYLKLPQNIFAGLYAAKQIWYPSTTVAVQNFNYIDNSPNAIPQKGDMVVWNGSKPYTGGAGHVAVSTGNGTLYWFDAFSQNDPYKTSSHVVKYSYDYVLGWLRLKTTNPTPPPLTDTQKVNAITKELQSGNSDGDKVRNCKKILGLA